MKKNFTFFLAALLAVSFASAQKLSDAIKLVDVDFKHQVADEAFKKLYAASPKDPEVLYWYVMSIIDGKPSKEELTEANQVIQKALNDGINAPLLWVASGHVELLSGGDINKAKQKFEEAITATKTKKGENPEILTAIGRANADEGINVGDAAYGIEKLKRAGELNKTDPDIFYYMGLCYRKLGSDYGGEAVKAFDEALARDPKDAKAWFQIGKIYQSQNNKDALEENFNAAIKADPTFPAAYLALYTYYADKDVNKAIEYLNDFLKYADKDPENDFFYADYLFRAGKYTESIAKAKEIEANTSSKPLPKINGLYAFDYDRLGDSTQAKTYIEKFFATAPLYDITPDHYTLAIKILSKFPGSEAEAITYIQKAMDNDTLKADKINYASQAADIWANVKDYPDQLKWLEKVVELKGTKSEFDFYKLTNAALNSKDYPLAMSIAQEYITAFPDKPQGYIFNVKAAKMIDTATSIAPIIQQNDYLSKDLDKNRKSIFNNDYYLLVYYAEKTKENEKAMAICDNMLALYPNPGEENDFALKTKEVLQKAMNAPAEGKKSSKSGGNKKSDNK